MYRIMAVEDDSLVQNMLGHAMRAEGFEFISCLTGGAALDLACREKPDLVILDINLPDMGGHDVCRRLKADSRTRHIPVIILTGEAREIASRVRGLDLGAEDYLFKPVSPKVLVSRINSILKTPRGR
ncbi:MAG: response regulator [Elusimicrobia bacterium]|nr:response regulator [Elusimicrobiota bacterium]